MGLHFNAMTDTKPKLTIADVRASQDLSKTAIPLVMRFIFVPAAWPLTVIASRLGLSPNAVTALRGVLYLVAGIMIAQSATPWFVFGFVLYLLAVVADSVDGNLSRLNDAASYFGKFADGLVDALGDLVLPVAVAMHLWAAAFAGAELVMLAFAGVACHAVSFLVIHRLPLFEGMLLSTEGPSGVAAARSAHPRLSAFLVNHSLGRLLMWFDGSGMNAVFDIRYIALFLCALADGMKAFVVILSILYLATMLCLLTIRILRAYTTLDLRRQSRSAA
jgi:phosphatidylglycerophosphate synthase